MWGSLVLALLVSAFSGSACGPAGPVVLGGPPVCEASGAAPAPWDPRVVLVVDNEHEDRLFTYRIGADGLLHAQAALPFPGDVEIGDPEAVAAAEGLIVVVGSHGRSRHCERRPKREGVVVLGLDGDRLRPRARLESAAAMDAALADQGACAERLFVTPAPLYATEVCAALHAAASRLSRERCVPPLDVEAAVAVPRAGRPPELWLGLRQPRVDGRSVLLRLVQELDAVRFDAVALVEGGDRGVRAMAHAAASVFLVLGPGDPDFDHAHLVRLPADALIPGAVLTPEVAASELPPSSEGVVIDGGAAIVVVDGDEAPDGRGPCSEPAHQLRVPLVPP